jgi:hypothetical protein
MIASTDNLSPWDWLRSTVTYSNGQTITAEVDRRVVFTLSRIEHSISWASEVREFVAEVVSELEKRRRQQKRWTRERIEIRQVCDRRWPPPVLERPRQSLVAAGRTCSSSSRWRVRIP